LVKGTGDDTTVLLGEGNQKTAGVLKLKLRGYEEGDGEKRGRVTSPESTQEEQRTEGTWRFHEKPGGKVGSINGKRGKCSRNVKKKGTLNSICKIPHIARNGRGDGRGGNRPSQSQNRGPEACSRELKRGKKKRDKQRSGSNGTKTIRTNF